MTTCRFTAFYVLGANRVNGILLLLARSFIPLPNSLSWMESADPKMIRAHENIEGIGREINEWFASIKVNMFLKTAADRPSPWLVVHANDYIPPSSSNETP